MPTLCSLGQGLDKRRWLGLSMWTFALCSLKQHYGRAFLRRVLLAHPGPVLQGLLGYRCFLAQQRRWGELVPVGTPDEERLWMDASQAGPCLLVGLGFCQKPGGLQDWASTCPAGRFTHRCRYLEQLEANSPTTGPRHWACQQCTIGALGTAALHAGSDLYIMTTAAEITEDLLLPTLTEGRFRVALLTLCPYSVEPMALALLICGLKAGIATYDQGACLDYDQWIRADGGDKGERASLPSEVVGNLVRRLERIAEGRQGGKRFRRQGNLYVACP